MACWDDKSGNLPGKVVGNINKVRQDRDIICFCLLPDIIFFAYLAQKEDFKGRQ
jgi:hypothetical protein